MAIDVTLLLVNINTAALSKYLTNCKGAYSFIVDIYNNMIDLGIEVYEIIEIWTSCG